MMFKILPRSIRTSFLLLPILLFGLSSLASAVTYEASYTTWSGYWWPLKSGGLVTGQDYNGHPTPLEKYDYVATGRIDGPAMNYGRAHYYRSSAAGWEGLCYEWAASSVMEPEPVHRGVYGNMAFDIGDKKALLTVAYDGFTYNQYMISDPVIFHQTLGQFIRKQRVPILMDLGDSGEKWYFPVYKYNSLSTAEGTNRHYTVTLYFPSDSVHPDFVGMSEAAATYYYVLRYDAEGNIQGGSWERESRAAPPNLAIEPLLVQPKNPGIDYNQVLDIVETVDDAYEDNDAPDAAAAISPGFYALMAGDDDYFSIRLEAGDRLEGGLEFDSGEIRMNIYAPGGIWMKEINEAGQFEIQALSSGDFLLEVIPTDPADEPFYELALRQKFDWCGIFPYNSTAATATNGFTLLLTDGEQARVQLSAINSDGSLRGAFFDSNAGPFMRGILNSRLGFPPPLVDNQSYIRIDADAPFIGLQAGMLSDQVMAGGNVVPGGQMKSVLYFPHIERANILGRWKSAIGIINTGDRTEDVTRRAYDATGRLVNQDTITLGPGAKVEQAASLMPVLTSGSVSMQVATASRRKCLAGYIRYTNPTYGEYGQALVSVNKSGSTNLWLPHAATDGFWWTKLGIMNTGESATEATLRGYDNKGKSVETKSVTLEAKQNLVGEMDELFSADAAKRIASIRITSANGQNIQGLALIGSRGEQHLLAGMPLNGASTSPIRLPHVAGDPDWWTGIGMVNTLSEAQDITISCCRADGSVLNAKAFRMEPRRHMSATLKGLFDARTLNSARYVSVQSSSGGGVSGLYLIGSTDGRRLMGDLME